MPDLPKISLDPAPFLAKPLPPKAALPQEAEPVVPPHVRLESGTMRELMVYVKAWLAWDSKRA